jgi:single-stranded DNA-binding protein
MIDALIAGKVSAEPSKRLGQNNHSFVTTRLNAVSQNGDVIIVNVIAFDDKVKTALMLLAEGDSVALSGHLNPKVWTGKDGMVKPMLDMIASRVVSMFDD